MYILYGSVDDRWPMTGPHQGVVGGLGRRGRSLDREGILYQGQANPQLRVVRGLCWAGAVPGRCLAGAGGLLVGDLEFGLVVGRLSGLGVCRFGGLEASADAVADDEDEQDDHRDHGQ